MKFDLRAPALCAAISETATIGGCALALRLQKILTLDQRPELPLISEAIAGFEARDLLEISRGPMLSKLFRG